MQKKRKNFHMLAVTGGVILILLCATASLYIFQNPLRYTLRILEEAGLQLASVILHHNFRTVAEIKSHYKSADEDDASQKKVRILIMPGHEPSYGGAEYAALKERDMTVELGKNLQQYLENDPHYDVFIARDTEAWSPDFASYFKNKWNDIAAWKAASREEFSRLVSIGAATQTFSAVGHNSARDDVAVRLYGITKWSNEHKIDIAIHIHFNDHPGRNTNVAGNYSGFSIYVPASQYGNSTTTKAIADSLFTRLAKYNPVSNLVGESGGVIDEPELIAVGANNTADAASMLIEYSYIYEPQFEDASARSLALKDLAFQTYLGLQDFFDPPSTSKTAQLSETALGSYVWKRPIPDTGAAPADVFALQTALMVDGVYPPNGRSKNDCPRTGIIGPCTRAALGLFQDKYDISGEQGVVGGKTLEVLNQL
jgi:N-acetylmuramoyl-L-alanine amidase